MRLRSVIAVTSVVLLAGCSGSVHPGSAAVVDGTSVSFSEADRYAAVFCELTLLQAQQQGQDSVDNALVRRQAVAELVAGVVATDLAEREGITVPRGAYAFTADQRAQAEQALPDADIDRVVEVLEAGQRTFAIAQVLGERETGQTADETNADQLQQVGREILAQAVADADVDVDPRFGLDDTAQQVATSGSLSVPADPEAVPAAPATSQCS